VLTEIKPFDCYVANVTFYYLHQKYHPEDGRNPGRNTWVKTLFVGCLYILWK